ncbi:hypothetical protein SAMN05518672_101361 [Chitinophaga sp. CF118]|uniref:hypothetical protein n=1 Tax=Chitinophaga sp. CF118 TaxID=1884367 RepID=UPI0008EF239B|nr:hypothetical protein [Chitinophaga sp. CF118]SFD07861.1 hypothetical protein SAMN05518672_101361 [Chitinophaga sp. CF118]
MNTYTLARGWKIFSYIFSAVLIIGCLAGLLSPLYGTLPEHVYFIILSCSIIFLILGILIVWETEKSKLVIDDRMVRKEGITTRELFIDEIDGYTIDEKFITLVPKSRDRKPIKITLYLEKIHEIKNWVSLHFTDLDLVERLNVGHDIYGDNPDVIPAKLNAAKRDIRIANVLMIALIIAAFYFRDEPYMVYGMYLLLLFPWAGIFLLFKHNGILRIATPKNSPYPSADLLMLIPSCVITLIVLIQINILNYNTMWLITGAVAIIFSYLLILAGVLKNPLKKVSKFGIIAEILFMSLAYAYGGVGYLNARQDKSDAVEYNVRVIDKRISKGKRTTYYLKLMPWGPQTKKDEVSVSSKAYEETRINNDVKVYCKKGWLGIAWYWVMI